MNEENINEEINNEHCDEDEFCPICEARNESHSFVLSALSDLAWNFYYTIENDLDSKLSFIDLMKENLDEMKEEYKKTHYKELEENAEKEFDETPLIEK